MQYSIAQYGFMIVLLFCCCSIVSLQYVWQYNCTVYSQNNLSSGSINCVSQTSRFNIFNQWCLFIDWDFVPFSQFLTLYVLCIDWCVNISFIYTGVLWLSCLLFFPKWLDCDKYFIVTVVLLCKFYPIISSVLVREIQQKKLEIFILFYFLFLPSHTTKWRTKISSLTNF